MTITCYDPTGFRFTAESLRPLLDTWPPSGWEHVVVDGSPALSRPVLDALPAGWPLVHIERPPRGVPHAFNEALAVGRGDYVWFLNGGDGLHRLAALSRVLAALDHDRAVDLVCGGAYLARDGFALYPTRPRGTLLANILGRSWMYHQAVVYRRESLARVGPYSTAYRATADYDYHVRCYLAGLRGRFTADVLVDYDMSGGSNDVVTVFREIKLIQRSHRGELPAWVNRANEVIRNVECARILALRKLAATRLGAGLRPLWTRLNRRLRVRRSPSAS